MKVPSQAILAVIGIVATFTAVGAPYVIPKAHWPFVFWGGISTMAVAAIWGILSIIASRKDVRWLRMWDIRFNHRDSWPFRRLIPYEKATLMAYEKTRNTIWSTMAERMSASEPQNFYATALWDELTELYGARLPSSMLELIPFVEKSRCGFIGNGAGLERHGDNKPLYERLHIKKSDLNRRIREMKARGKPA